MLQRTMFGPQLARFSDVRDATKMEMVPVLALVAAVLVVGIYPSFITDYFSEGLTGIVDSIQQSAQLAMAP